MFDDLIKKINQEYEKEFPYNTAFDLRPVGMADDLSVIEAATYKEDWEAKRQSYVFKKLLNYTEGDFFKEICAAVGNPDRLNPCDGEWHQCSLFCDNFGDCPYKTEIIPKVTKKQKKRKRKKK